jgi:hypothetical protein
MVSRTNGRKVHEQRTDIPREGHLFTFAQAAALPQYQGRFSVSSLRWMRFDASRPGSPYEGFGGCVFKIGRRVLLDVERFEHWLADRAEG